MPILAKQQLVSFEERILSDGFLANISGMQLTNLKPILLHIIKENVISLIDLIAKNESYEQVITWLDRLIKKDQVTIEEIAVKLKKYRDFFSVAPTISPQLTEPQFLAQRIPHNLPDGAARTSLERKFKLEYAKKYSKVDAASATAAAAVEPVVIDSRKTVHRIADMIRGGTHYSSDYMKLLERSGYGQDLSADNLAKIKASVSYCITSIISSFLLEVTAARGIAQQDVQDHVRTIVQRRIIDENTIADDDFDPNARSEFERLNLEEQRLHDLIEANRILTNDFLESITTALPDTEDDSDEETDRCLEQIDLIGIDLLEHGNSFNFLAKNADHRTFFDISLSFLEDNVAVPIKKKWEALIDQVITINPSQALCGLMATDIIDANMERAILASDRFNINFRDEEGSSLALIAASSAHLRILKKLVLKGADTRTANDYGDTPLLEAAKNGNFESFRFLLSLGMDATHRNKARLGIKHLSDNENIEAEAEKYKNNPVSYIINFDHDINTANKTIFIMKSLHRFSQTPMCNDGHRAQIKNYIQNVAGVKRNMTPFWHAINSLDLELVRFSLDMGVDVDKYVCRHMTSLEYAENMQTRVAADDEIVFGQIMEQVRGASKVHGKHTARLVADRSDQESKQGEQKHGKYAERERYRKRERSPSPAY